MRLGVLSDLHWMAEPAQASWHGPYEIAETPRRVREALTLFDNEGCDLVLIAGDLTHRGDELSTRQALAALKTDTSLPVRLVGGNHDCHPDPDVLSCQIDALGGGQIRLADPAGEHRDDVVLAGVPITTEDGWVGGRVLAQPHVPRWGERPAILLSHYPALSRAQVVADHGMPYAGDLIDRRGLADLLRARATPTVVVSGHIHVRETTTDGSVLQLSIGALVEAPHDCTLIDWDVSASALTRMNVRLDSGPCRSLEPVLAPEREAWTWSSRGWFAASTSDRDSALMSTTPKT
jgi:predicted phosphodiesterase